MPESILVQVGQCGNQIGFNFWQSLLQEYNYHCNKLSESDFSQFLKPKSNDKVSSKSLEENYTARGILIDMEEGVINVGRRSPIGSLFQKNQILTDVSGSGNNWAVGHLYYGKKYSDSIEDLFRIQSEACDNLEAFMLIFSLGGGTGSGLGTYALEVLADHYKKSWKMVFSVFPSDVDDVVTSPYNSALSNSKLLEYADIVIPFENHAIEKILSKLESNKFLKRRMTISPKRADMSQQTAFRKINDLIVSTILDSTSVSRYSNFSTKSLKEMTINLLPEPYLMYTVPSVAPIFASDDSSPERLFNDVFSPNNCLFDCGSLKSKLCGATVFARGEKLNLTVVKNNVNRFQRSLEFVNWADGNIQHGQCKLSPVHSSSSLVLLSNTSAVCYRFQLMKIRLQKMYTKKAHLHHFTNEDKCMKQNIDVALEKLDLLIRNYELQGRHGNANQPLIL